MRLMKQSLMALAAGLAFSGCHGHDNALRGELRDEKSKWLALGIHNYTYDYERSCFCGGPSAVQITVINDVVTRVVTQSGDQDVPLSPTDPYFTIPELYDYLIDATSRADQISVHFDFATHLPAIVYIDFYRNAADDELSLTVGNLVNAPSPQVTAANPPIRLQTL